MAYFRENTKSIGNLLKKLMEVLVGASIANYKKRHSAKLQSPENRLRLGIAFVLIPMIASSLLQTDWRLGLSFVTAGATAIWFGYVYKGRDVIGLVLVGVIIGTIPGILFPDAVNVAQTGDIMGAVIILAFGVFFYYLADQYKKGKRPKYLK